jgi:hypothetical protein
MVPALKKKKKGPKLAHFTPSKIVPAIFFFLAVLGLELRAFTLSYSASPFCGGFF